MCFCISAAVRLGSGCPLSYVNGMYSPSLSPTPSVELRTAILYSSTCKSNHTLCRPAGNWIRSVHGGHRGCGLASVLRQAGRAGLVPICWDKILESFLPCWALQEGQRQAPVALSLRWPCLGWPEFQSEDQGWAKQGCLFRLPFSIPRLFLYESFEFWKGVTSQYFVSHLKLV